jgi:hypothetical protein
MAAEHQDTMQVDVEESKESIVAYQHFLIPVDHYVPARCTPRDDQGYNIVYLSGNESGYVGKPNCLPDYFVRVLPPGARVINSTQELLHLSMAQDAIETVQRLVVLTDDAKQQICDLIRNGASAWRPAAGSEVS